MIEKPGLTEDGFLDNRLTVLQPKRGFRAGHDSVLLAASIEGAENSNVLELGSGVGVASLCLAARDGDCRVTGIEIDPELVSLAVENAKRNEMTSRVRFLAGDVLHQTFDGEIFDHVFLNPPFHPAAGQISPDAGRARAMHDVDEALHSWTERAIGLAGVKGNVTAIMRADRFESWRERVTGAVKVLRLLPRPGEDPKRVIARVTPRARSSYDEAKPFVLHDEDGKPTDEAEAVLRHGAPLPLG